MAEQYDVIVIGAGPAGGPAAGRLTGAGLTAAVVAQELVGGECSYWAYQPLAGACRLARAHGERNSINTEAVAK